MEGVGQGREQSRGRVEEIGQGQSGGSRVGAGRRN